MDLGEAVITASSIIDVGFFPRDETTLDGCLFGSDASDIARPTIIVADVAGSGEDLPGRGHCLLGHDEYLSQIRCGEGSFEKVDCPVYPVSVLVGRSPAVQIGLGANQWKDLIRKIA